MFREKKSKKHSGSELKTLDLLHAKNSSDISGNDYINYYLKHGQTLLDYYSNKSELNLNSFFEKKSNFNKSGGKEELLDKYLSVTEPTYISKFTEQGNICESCGSDNQTEFSDGTWVCSCGTQQNVITISELPSYKEPHHEKHNFSYRRSNHFKEIMNQIQAKETTEIQDEIMDKIRAEIKKQRISDIQSLTKEQIRDILKKIGHDDDYEHSLFILSKLTGVMPPQIPPHVCDMMENLFNEAQSLWIVHKPDNRKNFIAYFYVIYKIFELLGMDDHMQYCSLLKTREKLVEYDSVWKKICKDLKWEFIPTV
jgi:hypothetical protein